MRAAQPALVVRQVSKLGVSRFTALRRGVLVGTTPDAWAVRTYIGLYIKRALFDAPYSTVVPIRITRIT